MWHIACAWILLTRIELTQVYIRLSLKRMRNECRILASLSTLSLIRSSIPGGCTSSMSHAVQFRDSFASSWMARPSTDSNSAGSPDLKAAFTLHGSARSSPTSQKAQSSLANAVICSDDLLRLRPRGLNMLLLLFLAFAAALSGAARAGADIAVSTSFFCCTHAADITLDMQ